MAHDVFISYSNQDKTVADAACATLERRKIRCWIAPRDVPVGQPWASVLVNAINASQVMVLILSEGSNKSDQVIREVDEAVGTGIPILPLRIDDVEPSDQMRYYIKSIHWLDALSPPLERHLEHLADSVEALLSVGEGKQPQPVMPLVEAPAKKRSPLPIWATALLALAVVVIVGGVGSWTISQVVSPTERSILIDVASPSKAASTGEVIEDPLEMTSTPDSGSEWRPLSFMIPNLQIWEESEDNRYTALEQHETDAFAWSTEEFEGDLLVSLDLKSAVEGLDLTLNELHNKIPNQNSGCIIIYGDGHEYSYGSLIFCVDWDGYYLVKHTRYTDEPLAFIPSRNKSNKVYSVSIEIADDIAVMYANGEKVFSTFFDTEEIDRSGRIGLLRNWADGEITFSNIQIKRSPRSIKAETEPQEPSATPDWSDWQTLSFNIPSETIWRQSGENSYTAIEQYEVTAFLWSDEIFEGDLILTYDILVPDEHGEGEVIIYGDGGGYTQGSLLFVVEGGFNRIEKHTPYHDGENYLAVYEGARLIPDRTHAITVEIIGDKASLYVDGDKVASAFFTAEIVRRGRVGFTKFWEKPIVTYSNIKIKTRNSNE